MMEGKEGQRVLRDIDLLQELKKDAISHQRYHLAATFRQMELQARKEINTEFTEELLKGIETQVNAEEKKNIF